MNAFQEYLNEQLLDRLEKSKVVVWYDPAAEFEPYARALAGGEVSLPLTRAKVGSTSAQLAVFQGSLFAVKLVVEPLVSGPEPQPLIIYLPGVRRDHTGSVL